MEVIKYVVAYMRYSSEGQRDGYSIEAQKAAIEEFCKRLGYIIVHFYTDEAKTGTLDNREAFQQMIADSASGDFQAVIVHKFDRFSRDKYDNAIYKRELRNNGVRVISVLEPLDDSPESLILETLLEGMAQYYSENLAREVKKGQTQKALLAQHCGGIVPYGYSVNPDTSEYEIVPSEAEVVRKIYELYNNGTPTQEIADHLNTLGLKTRLNKTKGGVPFTSQMVRGIIANEKYNGTFIYRKTKRIRAKGRYKTVKQNDDEVIVCEDKVPRIVDNETWVTANKRLRSRTYNTTRAKVEYLLTGLMFCGECGSPFVGGGSVPRYDKDGNEVARYNYYICSKKRKTHDCKCSQVSKERIEDAVIKGIIDYCYNDKSIKIFADDFSQWLETHNNADKAEIARYKSELKKLEQQKGRLVSLALEGVLTPVETKDRKRELEAKITSLQAKLQSMEKTNLPSKKDIMRFMEDTRHDIANGTFDDYAGLIRQHLARIDVYNGYQIITLKKVPYLTEPDENDGISTYHSPAKSISDSECKPLHYHSVSLMDLPKELTITLRLEKGSREAVFVA